MEQQLKSLLKSLKVNEGLISSVMGGVVVVMMVAMIFNYFKSINKNGIITEEAAKISEEVSESNTSLPTTYKVQKGDDLWHISEKFYESGYNYVDIIKENKLENGSVITVGQELKIPNVDRKVVNNTKTPGDPKASQITKNEVEPKMTQASIEGNKYKTVKGDHLWSIAVRAYGDGYAWTKIFNANKSLIGADPGKLFVGVELILPR